MSQHVQAAIRAIPLLFILGLFLYVFLADRRLKKSQTRLIESLPANASTKWFRVKLSRPAFFRRRLKMLGCEARAVLISDPEKIRVVGELGSGEMIDRTYNRDDLNLHWLGNASVSSANLHWISIGSDAEQLMLTADTGLNAIPSRESTADMCRMLAPDFVLPGIAKNDFALEKNRFSMTVIALFFLLLVYALLDGVVLGHHEIISLGPVRWVFPFLGLAAIPTYFILVRGKVPSRESITLSVLVAIGLQLSAVPFAARVDRSLASAQSYDYKLGDGASLTPLIDGPPDLHFRQTKEYWAQFDEGSVHQFDLVHGPLGTWQLDHAKLDQKFLAFYDKLEAGK